VDECQPLDECKPLDECDPYLEACQREDGDPRDLEGKRIDEDVALDIAAQVEFGSKI